MWVGREDDVRVAAGVLSTRMGASSQRIWTYITDEKPVVLQPGQTLVASVSFIPRGELTPTTSRNFRFGLFYDPSDPRVEADVNADSGGPTAPWTDARGYAVQVLVSGSSFPVRPFDLGKRVNLQSRSLLGTSGDYEKDSGGSPASLEADKEYTVRLTIEMRSAQEVNLTSTLLDGSEELSSFSIRDDGSTFGSDPPYDKFDQLLIRISDGATTAERFDFTNFKVELE